MDRRAIFFLGAAVACAALVPVADVDHRPVAGTLAAVYVLLAVATWLDARAKDRIPPRPRPGRGQDPASPGGEA